MNDYLLPIIIGILSSFLASLIFLLFLTRVRPHIAISNQIAKSISSQTKNNEYRIKIINKTPRSLIDIKVQLHLVNLVMVPGGVLKSTKNLTLKNSELLEIAKIDTKDKDADFGYRFIILENLDQIWDNNSFLRFKFSAKDSLSGFSKVFTQSYHVKENSIEEGKFEIGDSLEIK